MNPPLSLIICADDPLARAGLAAMLGALEDVTILAQDSTDILNADEWPPELAPADALLWDVGWNGAGDSVEVVALDLPVVALIGDADQATEAWAAGVRGLLWRNTPEDGIMAAVQACCAGFLVMAPGLAEAVRPAPSGTGEAGEVDLTARETEVLQLVAQGMTNKAIGYQLAISEHTVKFHLNAILGKLGAQSRTDAVVKATRQGLISL
jgi:DNA-binding NarL/FixJ family response regulator